MDSILRIFVITIFSYSIEGTNDAGMNSLDLHRSKEANCLMRGYQWCLVNSIPSNHSSSLANCLRAYEPSPNGSRLVCKDNECLWNGTCVEIGSNSHHNVQIDQDWPISTYYEDVHTITVSFPKYSNTTAFYILETRAIVSNLYQPFQFAGASNQTAISYHVSNICDRYEFRLSAVLTNGSVVTFRSKRSSSNPPDFMVDNIRVTSSRYDPQTQRAVVILNWKHPYGYTNADVDSYDSYLHTLQCDASSETLNQALTDNIVRTDQGGSLTATFPEVMLERKCQFRLMIWATDVCKNRTLADGKVDIFLNCSTVQGYQCPAAELRPYCFSQIDVTASNLDSNNSVNVSWTPTLAARPQYYHLRWGKARRLDLRHKQTSSEEDTTMLSSGERSTAKSGSALRSEEIGDFTIWMLQTDTEVNEKVAGDATFTILSNVPSSTPHGVQLCAIFNGDFKRPEWPKVTTHGFVCTCKDAGCNGRKCEQDEASDDPVSGPTTLATIRPPMAIIRGVSQPPESIESITDFTEALIDNEAEGVRIRLSWKPPVDLSQDQILRYDTTVESLLSCHAASSCCDYAELTKIDQSINNQSGIVELFIPTNVIRSNCQFVAKTVTTAINGATSISLNNIRVPPSPYSTVLPLPQFTLSVHPNRTMNSDRPCDFLQCSHSCNSTHCTCPSGMMLDELGRTCTASIDPPVLDHNSCNTPDCQCLNGYHKAPDGSGCILEGDTAFDAESRISVFDYCLAVGCKYSCTPRGMCTCPGGTTLQEDGKSCDYKDSSLWNLDEATLPPSPPSILCGSPGHTLFTWSREGTLLRLNWRFNSTVLSAFSPNATVLIRIGSVSKNTMGTDSYLYLLGHDATTTSSTLAAESINLSLQTPPSLQQGAQFCVYNSPLLPSGNDSVNWDIIPVILLSQPLNDRNGDAFSGLMIFHSRRPNTTISDESDYYSQRTLAVAIVTPLSCVIIAISLIALFCYFYPAAAQVCWTIRRGRRTGQQDPSLSTGVEKSEKPKQLV